MATHSSIFAGRIPIDRGTWLGYSTLGLKELDMTEQLSIAARDHMELNAERCLSAPGCCRHNTPTPSPPCLPASATF